ncbi:mitochondrial carrier domain-containing protein [Pavlovales sp. CCMP2436]|nr:mitochondrial carrier domain-containing protein [Pavlovales sp. CCMP2436]
MEQVIDAASGGLAGVFSTAAVYPLEVIKTNLQAQVKHAGSSGRAPRTAVEMARDLIARDGVLGLYGGCQMAVAQAFVEKFIYFYVFSALKRAYTRSVGALSLPANVLLGYAADWAHLAFTMPVEMVAVRMQTRGVSAPESFRGILAETGPRGLYTGIAAYLVLCFKPAIQSALFEALRTRVLERAAKKLGTVVRELSVAQAFCLGALARAIATVLVFPCIRAKRGPAERNSSPGNGTAHRAQPAGLRHILTQVVREEGFSALYQGIRPELVKGVLSAAVLLSTKEKITAGNRRLLEAAFPSLRARQ